MVQLFFFLSCHSLVDSALILVEALHICLLWKTDAFRDAKLMIDGY